MISAKPPNLNYLSKSSISYHILASFLDPFDFKFQYHFTLICWCLFKCFFYFWAKRVPKLGPNKLLFAAFGFPKKFPKRVRVANSISYRFCIDFGLHFDAFFMTVDTLVGAFFRSWCWFTVPRRFQNPILSLWICRSPLGAAVAPRAYNYFWHHFFDQFSWSPKSRNLQHV